jgi:hypothetical protein
MSFHEIHEIIAFICQGDFIFLDSSYNELLHSKIREN